ncbi:hypothetical protein PybrP1_000896 [[Pythium] brassicae (nom. inval.)]|nr:hypothetical protein PybrP1_000896 [[Pythium] brassicae (nom. inval.)]
MPCERARDGTCSSTRGSRTRTGMADASIQQESQERSEMRVDKLVLVYCAPRGPGITKMRHRWCGLARMVEYVRFNNRRVKLCEDKASMIVHVSCLADYYVPDALLREAAEDLRVEIALDELPPRVASVDEPGIAVTLVALRSNEALDSGGAESVPGVPATMKTHSRGPLLAADRGRVRGWPSDDRCRLAGAERVRAAVAPSASPRGRRRTWGWRVTAGRVTATAHSTGSWSDNERVCRCGTKHQEAHLQICSKESKRSAAHTSQLSAHSARASRCSVRTPTATAPPVRRLHIQRVRSPPPPHYVTSGALTVATWATCLPSPTCDPPGFAAEHDAFLGYPQQEHRPRDSKLATWGKLVVGAAVGVAAVSYCVNVQSSLTAQRDSIALMQQQM